MKTNSKLKMSQVEELLLQSLEHELGGVKVYETALQCAQNDDLEEEWTGYLAETRTHVTTLEEACGLLGVDSKKETPGRAIVRGLGAALVEAMTKAQAAGDPAAAELVACECVVLAETKDHLDWSLLGKVADELPGAAGDTLRKIGEKIEGQEDEHLYHTRGWCRELWIASLGLPAVVPPLEEVREVTTAMGAAHAEQAAELVRLAARGAVKASALPSSSRS